MGLCNSTANAAVDTSTHTAYQQNDATNVARGQRGSVSRRADTGDYRLQSRVGAAAGSSAPRRAPATPPPTDPRMKKVADDRYYTIGQFHPGTNVARGKYSLDDAARRGIEVTSRNGRLYQRDRDSGDQVLMNTKPDTMFVMDGGGRLYAADASVVDNHTGFMAGGRVAGAGELSVQDGVLQDIDRSSGHYQPSDECHQQVLARLREMQVDIPVARATAPAQLGIRA
ncbi:hypothetical protein [Cupriavidus pampae]|uniref:Uncharacterized protein n=1 Tax=Cupriavidus pampae TaxID=659251 RepID=A0ABN7Y341_9BURK|nr:hypothetical protein [Cupriavidus pampae]CAG9166375.1 hypothetical protein LMG32289_00994 [Cupriavidus pampae]